MRKKFYGRTRSTLGAAITAACAAWAAPALAQDAALAPVIVTANKREQTLESVNGSVVVVEQLQLDDAQVRNTQDLGRVLPGVQLTGSGSIHYPLISVRGVTSAQDFYNPALTLYVDGVPQMPIFVNRSLLDVERVELFKGPQGTLYGKSAEGGVINVTTHQPDNTLRSRLRAGWSSRGGNLLEGTLALPLVKDMLYASVALRRDDAPGDLHNPATGADHQGGVRATSGMVKLRLAPAGAAWQASLAAGQECARASQDAYVAFNDIGSRKINVQSGMPTALADFAQRRCGNSQSLDAVYDFGQWKLSALAGWQQADIERSYLFGPYYTAQPENWRQDMQEIRLASQGPGRTWDGLFGLYRQATGQSRHYRNDLPLFGLNALDTRSHNETESVAAYGDLTWHATDALDLSGGLRLTRDRASTAFGGTTLNFANFTQQSFGGANSTRADSVLGRLSAGFRLDPTWRLYTSLAQGYKPGGYNLAPSSVADARAFARERATSYEAGARFNARGAQGSIAAYRIDIKDAQLYQGDSVGYQSLRNVGDSRSTGLEFDLAWSVSRQWTLNASGFINRARFTRYVASSACLACANNDVPFAPRHGLTLGLQGDLPSTVGNWRPRISARYLGAQYFDTANTLRQNAYTLIDAGLAWQVRPDTELAVYAHNLTNRAYRTYAFSGGAQLGNFAQVGSGRALGVTLSYAY
ncbi:TonB-dependent receptor [uncultured Herbaspirillum sp.]|uniref:TonB-dependent receptor n=1 Tax=uncultured Herbaspirillum sp. TaxID=160236 RepID=UPI0025826DDB|nr:TonB-dependent receptor [uncultured Herbaspirillum sp.]